MKMLFSDLVRRDSLVLTEGAVIERIRRSGQDLLDPVLLNSLLIYNDTGRKLLSDLHRQYIDVGRKHDLPMLVFTDTWRANKERLERAGMTEKDVNGDCFCFLRDIVRDYGAYEEKVYTGGLVGCKGDAYKPDEALSEEKAAAFHASQIEALAKAGVDLLFAATIPSLSEAVGIAVSMSRTGLPYVISFVLDRNGLVLDGTSVERAVALIDSTVTKPPAFYMANCCHPTCYAAAMRDLRAEKPSLFHRILGLQANASKKAAHELDDLHYLDSEEPASFAEAMMQLRRDFGTAILGGCCGTDNRHIEAIAEAYRKL